MQRLHTADGLPDQFQIKQGLKRTGGRAQRSVNSLPDQFQIKQGLKLPPIAVIRNSNYASRPIPD